MLVEKIRNGLGWWLTFVGEPEVDSMNNPSERILPEQVVMRQIFGGLRSEEGDRVHETLRTFLATWEQGDLIPASTDGGVGWNTARGTPRAITHHAQKGAVLN